MRRSPSRHRGSNGRYVAASDATPGKRSVSVSRAMFERVKEYALDNDVAMTWIVDEAVAPVLDAATFTAVPVAARRPARSRPAPPVVDPPIAWWLLPTGPVRK